MFQLKEDIILKENIKDFRALLLEAPSQVDIIDAIKNKKVMYIYYAGDTTISKGFRTIEIYAYGITNPGNIVIRAFQQAGASDSNKGLRRPVRPDRDALPQWRLFIVKNITSMLPTGKHFLTSPGKIRPKYNPNDKQMKEIIFAIQPTEAGEIKFIGRDSINMPDVTQQQVPTKDKEKIGIEAKKRKELTKQEIIDLYDLARNYYKKSTKDFIVIYKDNDFKLDYEKNRNKYDPKDILGNLRELFVKITGQEGFKLSNKWIEDQRNNFKKNLKK